ncbi:MAG: hypothetical protein M3Y33_00510 [Actinomycetota bacterium]|nr:hypothetical protein [Actinomycetota bacterium]
MDLSPQAVSRQLSDRIAIAGMKVKESSGRGIDKDGFTVEGWMADKAEISIVVRRNADAVERLMAVLEAAGAENVRESGRGVKFTSEDYGEGSTPGTPRHVNILLGVSDDSAPSVLSADFSGCANPRRCEICKVELEVKSNNLSTRTCSKSHGVQLALRERAKTIAKKASAADA